MTSGTVSPTVWTSGLHSHTLRASMPTSRPVLTQHGAFVMSGGDAVTTDTRIDPATIEARCRRLMAEHAATERRGWDSERARGDLQAEIDAWLDEWLAAVGASCFDEVAS